MDEKKTDMGNMKASLADKAAGRKICPGCGREILNWETVCPFCAVSVESTETESVRTDNHDEFPPAYNPGTNKADGR